MKRKCVSDLVSLAKQNSQWENHLKFLQQSLEKLNRDATVASKLCKETWDEVQMKELQEFDLKKNLVEVTQRQKEFAAAYELVK